MVKFGWETYSQTFSTTVFMDISQPLAASASWSSATGVGRLVMDPSLAHLTPQFNVWPDKSPISQLAARINPSSTYNTAQIQLDFNDGKFFMPMQCWCFFTFFTTIINASVPAQPSKMVVFFNIFAPWVLRISGMQWSWGALEKHNKVISILTHQSHISKVGKRTHWHVCHF